MANLLADLATLTITGRNADIAAEVAQTATQVVKAETRSRRKSDSARAQKAAQAASQMQKAQAACDAVGLAYKPGKILGAKATAAFAGLRRTERMLLSARAQAEAKPAAHPAHTLVSNTEAEVKGYTTKLARALVDTGVARRPSF
jgi:hypothetical protein